MHVIHEFMMLNMISCLSARTESVYVYATTFTSVFCLTLL